MPVHEDCLRALALVGADDAAALPTVAGMRAQAARLAELGPRFEPVHSVRDLALGGGDRPLPCRLYAPSGRRRLPLVVFLHGGGWVAGGLDVADRLCRALANASGWRVLSVGYRLAPEHPFPCAVQDAVRALRWAAAHRARLGADGLLALAGESAGANVAAGALHAGVRLPALALALLVNPPLDARGEHPSHQRFATGHGLTAAQLRWCWERYLPRSGDRDDPRASPLADAQRVTRLPPLLVLTAEHDVLRDEAEAYVAALRARGFDATARRHRGMVHGFLALAGAIGPARGALDELGAALRAAAASAAQPPLASSSRR